MTNTALSSSSSSSKAGVLRSGIAARKDTLLLKLGGKDVLHKAVDTFYDQLVKDPELEFFFRDIPDVSILKWHQFNFMSVAFAPVPENFDVAELILNKHARLFRDGLNVQHFDLMLRHFRETLQNLNINPEVIEEAMEMLQPIRPIFAQGAARAKAEERSLLQRKLILQAVAFVAISSFVVLRLVRLRRR